MSRKPIRIAVLHFAHETVTFLKNDTTLADFIYPGSPAKGEALLAHDPQVLHGRLREDGARVRRGRTGRHRIAALAQDRHRVRLDHAGGLRDLRRQDDLGARRRRERSTASISACTAPWACAAWRGPKPSWPGGCARSSGPAPSSSAPSTRTATRTRNSCATPTWRSRSNTSRTTTATCRASARRACWCGRSAATTRRPPSRSACRSFRRPCCNGPAPRRGWTWCSARSPGRRANPTSM